MVKMISREERLAICIAALIMEEELENTRIPTPFRRRGRPWGIAHRVRSSEGVRRDG
jgi:hypothetical protein|tara:strand:+ start:461 stop:631 length:171 start_codon:yes stop_codon:yes gene_type:complete